MRLPRLPAAATGAVLALIGALSATSTHAALLTEDFNNVPAGLKATDLGAFEVTGGTVDVVPVGGEFNFYPGNGRFVDLDGSTGKLGQLTSKMDFGAGSYLITFALGGSQRPDNDTGGENSTTISLGSFSTTLTLASLAPLKTFSFYTGDITGGKLAFTETDDVSDNIGNVLDNVTLSTVPIPATLPMFGAGLLVLGAFGYMRRKGKSDASAFAA